MIRKGAATAAGVLLGAMIMWFAVGGDDDLEDLQVAADMGGFRVLNALSAKGDAHAQNAIAVRYREGRGVDRDLRAAVRWHTRAAKNGNADAQYALGRMYENGEGLRADPYRAAEWYAVAAGAGNHRDAQFALGRLYYRGLGVPHDTGEAITWYLMAARQGHPAAQYVMGALYAGGGGVDRDYVEAYKWYSLAVPNAAGALAADQRFDPVRARRELAARMNRFQIARAERQAGNWRPTR